MLGAALPGASGRCRRAAAHAPRHSGKLARLRRSFQDFRLFKHFEMQLHPKGLVVTF